MKPMERIYNGIILSCLLGCFALVGRMGAFEAARVSRPEPHLPPESLLVQEEPVPETDPTAHAGSLLLEQEGLTAQLKQALPGELDVRSLTVQVTAGGQLRIRGSAGRDGLLGWVVKKKPALEPAVSLLRLVLPEEIDFSMTLQARREKESGLVLTPVTASVAGQELALEDIPEPVAALAQERILAVLARNGGADCQVSFLEGGVRLS